MRIKSIFCHLLILISFMLVMARIVHAQALPIRNDTPTQLRDLGSNLNVGRNFAVNKYGQSQCSLVAGDAGVNNAIKLEDGTPVSGDAGIQPLYVRQDTPTAGTGANGRYGYAAVDSLNRQQVVWSPNATLSKGCSSAATTTADTQILANAGGAIRYYITSITCANTSAVASEVVFKDGTTAVWRGGIGTAAATGGDYKFDFGVAPLRLSANTAFQFAMTTTATSTTCCANGFQITD